MIWKIKNKINAFTLIEMMVVIAVFAILTTIMVANYNNSKDRRNLNNSAEYLAAVLREARTMAQTGQTFDDLGGARPKNGLGVYIQDQNTYILFANQDEDDNYTYSEEDVSLQTYSLSKHIIFTESQVHKSFVFTADGGMYFLAQETDYLDNGSAKLTIDSNLSIYKCVKVEKKAGKVEIGECETEICPEAVSVCSTSGSGIETTTYSLNEYDSCVSLITTENCSTDNSHYCDGNDVKEYHYVCGLSVACENSPIQIENCEYGCTGGVCNAAPSSVCGNGIIEGDEACDGGATNNNNGNGCNSDCSEVGNFCGPSRNILCKLVFISAAIMPNGNLGGLSGADAKCQNYVDNVAVNLYGVYKAWLSSDTANPANRFVHGERDNLPYYLVDRTTLVANHWTDLITAQSGGDYIWASINKTEYNNIQAGVAWTGTNENGTSYSNQNCSGWTRSTTASPMARHGDNNYKTYQWTSGSSYYCNNSVHRLYCFEQ